MTRHFGSWAEVALSAALPGVGCTKLAEGLRWDIFGFFRSLVRSETFPRHLAANEGIREARLRISGQSAADKADLAQKRGGPIPDEIQAEARTTNLVGNRE